MEKLVGETPELMPLMALKSEIWLTTARLIQESPIANISLEDDLE